MINDDRKRTLLAYKLLRNWRRVSDDSMLSRMEKVQTVIEAEVLRQRLSIFDLVQLVYPTVRELEKEIKTSFCKEDCDAVSLEIGTLLNLAARACPEYVEKIVPKKDKGNVMLLENVAPDLVKLACQ